MDISSLSPSHSRSQEGALRLPVREQDINARCSAPSLPGSQLRTRPVDSVLPVEAGAGPRGEYGMARRGSREEGQVWGGPRAANPRSTQLYQ